MKLSIWYSVLGALVLIYLGICIFFYFYQESFLFHPRKTAADFVYEFDRPFTERIYETPNNGKIHTLKFEVENPKGLVFYLHGNAGSLRDWGWVHRDFTSNGYDFIILDYRTYGKSTGKLSESNMHQDAAFIYAEMEKAYKEKDIIIYGRSIGTGMATKLASSTNAAALVLESPYYSIADIAKKVAPVFPLNLLLKYKFESFKCIKQVKSPIFIIHGDNDSVVPYETGYKLYEVCKENTTFYTVKNGHHNDLAQYPVYQEMLSQVLK